ncbi:MAG: response regulator transcription factor, partial [Chloroflexota bacterium]
MAKILVVEDEHDLSNLIRGHLEAEGHTVFQAFDGPEALAIVEREGPNLVILDWMLPGLDGLTVCRRIRREYLMPIIMLTARGEEVDRVLGLEVGADDYVVKPFSIRELMARVRATLRRVALDSRGLDPKAGSPEPPVHAPVSTIVPAAPSPLLYGPLLVDPGTHAATLDGVD